MAGVWPTADADLMSRDAGGTPTHVAAPSAVCDFALETTHEFHERRHCGLALALVGPAVLFVAALFLRQVPPPDSEPALAMMTAHLMRVARSSKNVFSDHRTGAWA